MKFVRHTALSVRGCLKMSDKELKDMAPAFTVDGVKLRTAAQVREVLMEELSQGHEMLPMSDECDNFDYKTGCRGHEQEEDPDAHG